MGTPKLKTVYACGHCGHQTPKWLGRCPECGHWGTLAEETIGPAAARPRKPRVKAAPVSSIHEVPARQKQARLKTGLAELDRVLGGGLVSGSAILIGGAPGIGKSTLLLQSAGTLTSTKRPVLYASAEESLGQLKLRAERLGVDEEKLFVCAETSLDTILSTADAVSPGVLIVDSLQTVFDPELDSAPGTVSQVRQCAGRLTAECKKAGRTLFLVGHVTKEGAIAGPRVVEHLVDTVLYFEESAGHPYRMLRAVKNRFGSTNELGVFSMGDGGLAEVPNPSELFLAERPEDASGSIVAAAVEGTRPVLVEIQALASATSFGNPRRTALGIDPNRAALLTAILEKKAGLAFAETDVYLNVAGGLRLREPAVDLPVACALASSLLDRTADRNATMFGELGLTGEVRAVTHARARVKESAKLGFERVILPQACLEAASGNEDIELIGVKNLQDALDVLW